MAKIQVFDIMLQKMISDVEFLINIIFLYDVLSYVPNTQPIIRVRISKLVVTTTTNFEIFKHRINNK